MCCCCVLAFWFSLCAALSFPCLVCQTFDSCLLFLHVDFCGWLSVSLVLYPCVHIYHVCVSVCAICLRHSCLTAAHFIKLTPASQLTPFHLVLDFNFMASQIFVMLVSFHFAYCHFGVCNIFEEVKICIEKWKLTRPFDWLSTPDTAGPTSRPYPLSFWFVLFVHLSVSVSIFRLFRPTCLTNWTDWLNDWLSQLVEVA